MALNDDSKPFAVLKQNSEDFLTQFDQDLHLLRSTFSSQISSLLCDPDSLGSSETRRLNAHLEFSKAKYAIFAGMKDLVGSISNQWNEQLEQMMATFLENVEIFIAGTKLSVTLPSPSDISKLEKKRSPEGMKQGKRKTTTPPSSIYPSIAKHFPGLSSFLSNTEESEQCASTSANETPSKQRRSPKQVTILTPEEMQARNSFMGQMDNSESESESGQASDTPTRRGRKSVLNTTPVSLKKTPARSSLRKVTLSNSVKEIRDNNGIAIVKPSPRGRVRIQTQPEMSENSSSEETSANTTSRRKSLKRNVKEVTTNNTSADQKDEDIQEVMMVKQVRGIRKSQALNNSVLTPDLTPGRRNRRGKIAEGTLLDLNTQQMDTTMESEVTRTPRSSKSVHFSEAFSQGLDVNEDLEIYTPEVTLTRSAPRRKTTFNTTVEFDDYNLTPVSSKGRGKRKTIAVSLAEEAAPSPKRLKRGGGKSSVVPPPTMDLDEEDNLLDSDSAGESSNYSSWISLNEIGAKVPAQPGVYELKVSAAKKPAYIGACDSLRQKLTLHKLKHNSGHKHLDKFVERNAANILVRYETIANVAKAKEEEVARVKAFKSQYKTTPAYN